MPNEIEEIKQRSIREYQSKYRQIIDQWNEEGEDAFWLMYAANYLFRWGGLRWIVDPLTLAARTEADDPSQPDMDFGKADLVILTHRHADHLDKKLLKEIARKDLLWIIPEFLLDELKGIVDKGKNRVIIPKEGEPIEISGLSILPIEGSHWENELVRNGQVVLRGVPSFSYLFTANHKNWFLPGDTRTYDITRIPAVGELDGLIAHLWLGRKSALKVNPPLLQSFCEYFLAFKTKQIVISHLFEWGREDADLWQEYHARMVVEKMIELDPSRQYDIVLTGQKVIVN